jgi:hypothetical protein
MLEITQRDQRNALQRNANATQRGLIFTQINATQRPQRVDALGTDQVNPREYRYLSYRGTVPQAARQRSLEERAGVLRSWPGQAHVGSRRSSFD